MDLTKRLGDGRRDNTYRDCPKCLTRTSPYSWKPTMHVPMEGRTDIVKCWSCGHEEPRFVEPDWVAEEDLKAKPHKGSRRGRSCSCASHGSLVDKTGIMWDFECPIHGDDGIDW